MNIKVYPILRLAIFLSAGIFFGDKYAGICPAENLSLVLWAGIFLLMFGALKVSYGRRWLFGVGASCIMFLIGWLSAESEWRSLKNDWPTEKQAYRAVVLDVPLEKEKSIQCKVKVNDRKVQLSLFKDSLSSTLGIGDELLLYTQIQSPTNHGNPYEFDYARYLYHHQVGGSAYAHSGNWVKRECKPTLSLKQKALLFREKVIDKMSRWGMDKEHLSILSALTLGCKRELDEEVRDIYSIAGISHVLALSGMHIGIIWVVLGFLLKPVALIRGGKWIKWFISTSLLWTFAFVVGLEASVVRAVIMCMLMELAKLAGTKGLSLNTLAIAAMLMLLYHPFYLFDIGFQLSFVAVAAIVLFFPLLFRVFREKSRLVRFLGGIMCVSVSAQLGTAPLVMYYFSNFSVYFLLTNLVASILVPIIIVGTFTMILVAPIPFLHNWIMFLLTKIVQALNETARWVSELPHAFFSISSISSAEIILFYLLLAILSLYGIKEKRRFFIGGIGVLALLLVVHVCVSFPQVRSAEIVFYHVKNCPAIHLIESDGTSYVVSETKDGVVENLEKVAGRFWKKAHIKKPVLIQADTNGYEGLVQENIIVWHGRKIGLLSDNRWQDKSVVQKLNLDYLVVCKGFNQSIESIFPLFKINKVVLDASLSKYEVERFKKECQKLGLGFVDIASEGSLRIFL